MQGLIARVIREGLRSGAWADGPTLAAEPVHEPVVGERGRFGESEAIPAATQPKIPQAPIFAGNRPELFQEFAKRPVGNGSDAPTAMLGAFDRLPQFPASPHSAPSVEWDTLSYIGCFARCYLFFSDATRMLAVTSMPFMSGLF